MLSDGCVFPQPFFEPTFEPPAGRHNVCAFPTEEETRQLAAFVMDRSLTVVSIGCGGGFVEGLLQRRHNVPTICVDLAYYSGELAGCYDTVPRFCDQVLRVPPSAIFRLPEGTAARAALLFCYGRRVPMAEYLRRYDVPAVVIIGDPDCDPESSNTQPGAHDLRAAPGWRVAAEFEMRSVPPRALCVIYERLGDELDIDAI